MIQQARPLSLTSKPVTAGNQLLHLKPCQWCSEVEGSLGGGHVSKRLRLFVPSAAEIGRQRESAQLGSRHQLSMVRTALRLGRQVRFMPSILFLALRLALANKLRRLCCGCI